MGRVILPVTVGQVKLPRFTFYVTTKGTSRRGLDLCNELGGTVQLGHASVVGKPAASVAAVSSSSPPSLLQPVLSPQPSSSLSAVSLADYPTLTTGLGRLRGFVHRPKIDLSVKPVQQRFYHQPLALRQLISDELRRLERDGVIERITSSVWTSNIVVTRKRCGTARVCINLSDVNRAIVPERYPLPTMEELTEKIAGCTVFSKIDLAWSYTQLELAEECRYLTAFVTHEGVYRARVLRFGLASGPSAFQQVIRLILRDLEGVPISWTLYW